MSALTTTPSSALAGAGKAGVAPFGWPDAFVAFLAVHQAGFVSVPGGLAGLQWRRQPAPCGGRPQLKCMPPLTTSRWPETKPAPSVTR